MKNMESIMNEEYGEIRFDPVNKILFVFFRGKIAHEEYKSIWDTLLTQVSEKGIVRAIIDQNAVEKVGMESRAWVVTNWLPKAKNIIPAGTKIGVISAQKIFSRIGGEYIASAVKRLMNVQVGFFPTEADAVYWIIQEEKPKTSGR